ncbi:hypothetical protein [Thermomonas sp.]|uniref:hypothetical protein n=1 Tax=Thermomonas sp. TaxID=1971895 RepID=UPI00391AFC04
MTDYTAGMPPTLPVEALREALGQAELDVAAALVDAHDRAVRQFLTPEEAVLLDPRQHQAWLNLLEAQQAMLAELGQRRDHVAGLIQQLQRHQRGASAYLQAQG